jgi:hypothetical protein
MERCQEDREGQLFPGYQGACFPSFRLLCCPCVTDRSFNLHIMAGHVDQFPAVYHIRSAFPLA